MEKISVPASMNIINASELNTPKLDNAMRAVVNNAENQSKKTMMNNPFLNMSDLSPIAKISSTNPFRDVSGTSQDGEGPSSLKMTSPVSLTGPNPFRDVIATQSPVDGNHPLKDVNFNISSSSSTSNGRPVTPLSLAVAAANNTTTTSMNNHHNNINNNNSTIDDEIDAAKVSAFCFL